MRWHVLRTLLHKEALRHLANRGGLMLVLLLVVAALLLSTFGGAGPAQDLLPGVRHCFVDYWEGGPLVEHLRANVPPELAARVRFRPAAEVPADAGGTLLYAANAGAIQLRPGDAPGRYRVWFWHPGEDEAALAPFEAWFWKESLRFYQARPGASPELVSAAEAQRSGLTGAADRRAGAATALVLFGLFLVCVYLLPSLTCEERERGTLLAQALSPASPREIVAAKLLFYPAVGLVLAAALAGACRPAALGRPFFWLAVITAATGAAGIGLTIASLARTQRAAGLLALCYTLAIALLLLACRQYAVPVLPWLALEYHTPRLLHAALTGADLSAHGVRLAAAAGLGCAWVSAAAFLFRRRGWQ
jgi:hypothetical protein